MDSRKIIESIITKITNALFFISKKLTYHTINDYKFTMDRYIQLVVDNNFNALKKLPLYIPKTYLEAIYGNILLEYAKLSENEDIMAEMRNKEQLMTLYKRYEMFRWCGLVLTSPYANDEDKKKTYQFLSNSGIRKDYLNKLEGEMKVLSVKIEDLKKKVDTKKDVESTQKSDFSRIFAFLEKNGYRASINMPVLEYIETMKLYKSEVKRIEKEINKAKT